MAKLIVELPEELHRELKKTAALSHRTIKNVVTDLVEEYISREEKREDVTETGLCGKWEDTRTPEAIIADIKAHRNWLRKGTRKVA
jgi:predicted transcriptional regulator